MRTEAPNIPAYVEAPRALSEAKWQLGIAEAVVGASTLEGAARGEVSPFRAIEDEKIPTYDRAPQAPGSDKVRLRTG